MRAYVYEHVVGFEETNLVGNVYYVNYLRWQGRCRELFLYDHAPSVVDDIRNGLCLVTTRVECDMFEEVTPGATVVVRMGLEDIGPNLIVLGFDYLMRPPARGRPGGPPAPANEARAVARGRQDIRCARRVDGAMLGCEVPEVLREALLRYVGRR